MTDEKQVDRLFHKKRDGKRIVLAEGKAPPGQEDETRCAARIRSRTFLLSKSEDALTMVVKRIRSKPCKRCQKTNDVLYRVRIDETKEWIFVCPVCLEEVKPNNPLYQYGGTWKSKKRH